VGLLQARPELPVVVLGCDKCAKTSKTGGTAEVRAMRERLRGAKLADVTRKYRMHNDIERELKWMGPMKEVPEKLG
jgi:hypothetical protein